MTKEMAFCNIQYTYESYVGIDVEKLAWKIHDYVQREFAEFHPLVSEPGNGVEMPDYVDVILKTITKGAEKESNKAKKGKNLL